MSQSQKNTIRLHQRKIKKLSQLFIVKKKTMTIQILFNFM